MIASVLLSVALAAASSLDALEDAVRTRWESVDPGTGPLTPALRDLRAALDRLEVERIDLLDDLSAAGPAARRLDPRWPEFDGDLAAAFADLGGRVQARRDALAAWAGSTGSPKGEVLLERGIARADRILERADGAAGLPARARLWRRACTGLERTRRSLFLAAPEIGPAPFGGIAPAFSLVDANPNSPGSGLEVSPADHLGRVTAWYYTRLG
jgi:hypothetical protein